MTLQHLITTHGHQWLIRGTEPAARRLRPLNVCGMAVYDLTLTGPDPDSLAEAIAAHDRLAEP